MTSREQFEAWWEINYHNGNPPRFGWAAWRDGDGYMIDDDESEFDGMWQAWQAATKQADGKCAALAAESEDRRQFILNGVEMGFIRLPDEDTKDPAKATYERCLNGIQYAPCQKCNGTGMADSGGTQPWGEPIEIECDCRLQDANTAELVAAGIITKVGE